MKFSRSVLSLALMALALGACTHTNLPTKPEVQYPESFSQSAAAEQPIDADWWKYFNAPELNRLLALADAQSPDLLISAQRVRAAEYQLNIANASWFPSVSLSGSSGESHSKESGQSTVKSESTRATLGVSYEVDLWGGIAAERRSANYSFNATRFDQASSQLSIRAAIASGWFQWLTLQERIATAQKNIEIAQRITKVVQARYDNGAATAADLAQQKTNLLTQQASLLPLQLQARQTQSALAILLGQTPQGFALSAQPVTAIAVPKIQPGTPANLVLRRPDLAASEASLVAADADLVATRAAMFPSMSLSASAGRSTAELFSLNPATQVSSWSLSLAQTLFNGGRLLNQKRYSEAKRAELLLQYHKAILTGLQEVDVALVSVDNSAQQEASQQAILVEAERSLRLSEARYREGSDDVLALLSAQRTLFQAQDALVQQHLARLTAAVDLYKALGGGWSAD